MSETAAVLFANDAFYLAFATRDLSAMEALWAKDCPVACIHPGWPALDTREEIMESWRGILSNERAPDISCHRAQAFAAGDAIFVICYEAIGDSVLAATNIFVRQADGWKLAHHHAGPCNLPLAALEPSSDTPSMQ